MRLQWMIVIVMLCGITVTGAYAQQRDTVRSGDEEENSFDKKLSSDIEDFIQHLTDQWEHGWNEPKYSDTSAADLQAGENPSDIPPLSIKGTLLFTPTIPFTQILLYSMEIFQSAGASREM